MIETIKGRWQANKLLELLHLLKEDNKQVNCKNAYNKENRKASKKIVRM